VGILEAIEEKIRIQFRIRIQIRYLVLGVGHPDPYQNVTYPDTGSTYSDTVLRIRIQDPVPF
jgi:hypothetical protein